ncbi:MAG: flagellin [Desulfobulbaceae bacterium]|nr:flagellin [Desulfobulbaceae bacterium]
MTLRINTNISALMSHKNMIKNDNSLSASLEKLSSGLRINKAADDASGMAIADSLKSQALGLGQALRNANDGISIVQTADGALEESINIVNTIKTKAIQSAQDGQTTESRKAIQADITKLMEELDTIAKTTSFNGQKLLSGNFINKKFQVGAYSGETVNISIGSAEATKVGHISTSNLTFGGVGKTELNLYSNLQDQTFSLNAIDIQYSNSREQSLGAVADAINKLSDVLGITAKASVTSTTDNSVVAGTTDSSFAINGVNIGQVIVDNNDSSGKLVAAINFKTDQHGVFASLSTDGKLTLTSVDDRAIQVTQDANTTAVLGGTSSMSTLGTIRLTQAGTGEIQITDKNAVTGVTVSAADGSLKVSGMTASVASSLIAAGSVLASGTIFSSGTILQGTSTVTTITTATTLDGTVIAAGSVLQAVSLIGSGTTLGGKVTAGVAYTTAGDDSKLTAGTLLVAGTTFTSGTSFEGDVTAYLSGSAAGAVVFRDGQTFISGGGTAAVKTGDLTLTAGATLVAGAVIAINSELNTGSVLHGAAALSTKGLTTIDQDMLATAGFVATVDSTLTTGTKFVGGVMTGKLTVAADMTMTIGSKIADTSTVANGSTLSTAAGVGGTGVIGLSTDELVGPKDMIVGKGTSIASGSTLAAGTVLSDAVVDDSGFSFAKGTMLTRDIKTGSTAPIVLTGEMTLKSGSILKATSLLGDSLVAKSANAESQTSGAVSYRLSDVNVTTQEGAQIAITVADAALKNLDKVRSDLGSVQNQLTSTVANISVTKVNVTSAESNIRDVDFAEESANFSKMQILVQASSFAMAHSNASGKAVLSLLQG